VTFDVTLPPSGTLRDMIDARADQSPTGISHIFADEGGRELCWGELRAEAANVALRLAGMGVQTGESVALCMQNSRDGILGLYGVLYGGFRATPLNLVAGADAMGYAVSHSEAKVALVGVEQRHVFEAALASQWLEGQVGPVIVEVSEGIRWPSTAEGVVASVDADDPALLMYTSGTTGRPKGVVHSQASLLAGGWTPSVAHALTPTDRAMCVLPFFHINGLCVTLMGPLVSGGVSIVCTKFSNSKFWRYCSEYQATWASVVPTIISHLLHGELMPEPEVIERLRFIRSASAPLAIETQVEFEKRFGAPIVETMGLTETAAQILSNPLPPGVRKVGSPGVAVGNEACIILDGVLVDAHVSGELAIRGPNVMFGYLNNPEANAETFTEDGWLLTGDLGHMDDDGYVYITGRRKELIIKGGENIAPREIDEALYTHPAVVEAAAFPRPCASYGQRVEAAVQVRAGSAVTEAELIALCCERVGAFKAPDKVHFLDELPKGPSGKIQRIKLPDMTA
jgi:acyl-CoA synthetase (AMP-forming)/AMP-acid ligase II